LQAMEVGNHSHQTGKNLGEIEVYTINF